MSPKDQLFLNDLTHSCEKILRYSSGLTREQFFAEEKTYDAVLRNLEILGEAVKHLSPEFRAAHPQIEWRKIAGLRDMVIHEYFGLDAHILWDVVSNEVPQLREQLRLITR